MKKKEKQIIQEYPSWHGYMHSLTKTRDLLLMQTCITHRVYPRRNNRLRIWSSTSVLYNVLILFILDEQFVVGPSKSLGVIKALEELTEHSVKVNELEFKHLLTIVVADLEGGATGAPPPPKIWSPMRFFFLSHFVSECLKISLR